MHVQTTTYICDRCEAEQEIVRGSDGYAWGEIKAATINGPFSIATIPDGKARDICPDCTKSLESWWKAGRAARPRP